MEKIKFDAVFPIICSSLAEKISSELNLSDEDAIKKLYSSRIYELMEQEETKFWQYSTEKLFEMYLEESSTGNISFPQV
jgi:hypothetical protein